MDRRETVFALLALGAAAAPWPLAAQAQQSERMRRIGVLMGFPEGTPRGQANITALREGLQSLGWVEGRNITGFSNFETTVGGKWLQLLGEIVSRVQRVGFIFHPDAPPNVAFMRAAEAAALSVKLKFIPLSVHNANEIERGITAFAAAPGGGLIVAPHAVTLGSRDLITALAARHRLPAVYSDRSFADSGGMLSFGNNTADQFRRAATYVDKILKGAKPADLPVQLPTKFELVVNMKTVKALGLKVPQSIQIGVDEVIE